MAAWQEGVEGRGGEGDGGMCPIQKRDSVHGCWANAEGVRARGGNVAVALTKQAGTTGRPRLTMPPSAAPPLSWLLRQISRHTVSRMRSPRWTVGIDTIIGTRVASPELFQSAPNSTYMALQLLAPTAQRHARSGSLLQALRKPISVYCHKQTPSSAAPSSQHTLRPVPPTPSHRTSLHAVSPVTRQLSARFGKRW